MHTMQLPLLQQIAAIRQNPPKGDTREADPGGIIMKRMMTTRTLGGTTATTKTVTLITMMNDDDNDKSRIQQQLK